jgi:tetratricopeptide (TPR) repeat protein
MGSLPFSVLFRIRSNVFSHPGGDTVILDRLSTFLKTLDIPYKIDLERSASLDEFSIVHLFNFGLPDELYKDALLCINAGVPYVITALAESRELYQSESHYYANALIEYVKKGQNERVWQEIIRQSADVMPEKPLDNSFVIQNAASIYVSGESEVTFEVAKDKIEVIPFGIDHTPVNDGAMVKVKETYALENFLLCVGRIEARKNQLILLKALEDVELTLVLAGGGFTYQPEYEWAVRNFRRRGKTIILGRLSEVELAALYQEALVHILPSWFELPGLVTLEAAIRGTPVIAGGLGSIKDYLGNKARYIDAAYPESILSALVDTLTNNNSVNKEHLSNFTWNFFGEKTVASYQRLLEKVEKKNKLKGIELAESEASKGRFVEARAHLKPYFSDVKEEARAFAIEGIMQLAEGRYEEAWNTLNQSVDAGSQGDPRTLTALGICEVGRQNYKSAWHFLETSLKYDPYRVATLHQMIECANHLNSFDLLVGHLEKFLESQKESFEWRFCLAGAYFRIGDDEKALELGKVLLAEDANHQGVKELLDALAHRVKTTPPDIDKELLHLEEIKRNRDFTKVIAESEALLQIKDLKTADREKLLLLQGESFLSSGAIKRASSLFTEVLALSHNNLRALCGNGAILASKGDWSGAERILREVLAKDPEHDVALTGLGLCMHRLSDLSEAFRLYRSALKSNPENTRALLGAIELGHALNELKEVEQLIITYLDYHPGDLEFLYSLAGCYYAQKRIDEARLELEKITLFRPDHEKAVRLLQKIGNPKEQSEKTLPFS